MGKKFNNIQRIQKSIAKDSSHFLIDVGDRRHQIICGMTRIVTGDGYFDVKTK